MHLKSLSKGALLAATVTSASLAMAEGDDASSKIAELEKRLADLEIKAATPTTSTKANPIQFNGFYSVGLSQIDGDDTKGVQYETGQTDELEIYPNTLVGLQLNAKLYDGGQFVTQLVSLGYEDGKDRFEPQVDWLYYEHSTAYGLSAQLGRIRFPLLMESGNYHAGYSYPWVSAPTGLYNALPLTNLDGGSLAYKASAGDWYFDTQVFGGKGEISWSEGDANLKNVIGLAFTTGNDELTLRLAAMQADQAWDATNSLQTAGFGNAVAATGDTTTLRYNFGDEMTYYTASVKYDNGGIYVSAEALAVEADEGYLPEDNSYNVTLGYHFGEFMPFIGYSYTEVKNGDELADNIDSLYADPVVIPGQTIPLPPPAPPVQVPSVNIGDFATRVLNEQERGITLGLRWDFMPKTALKVQVQYLDDFNGTIGNFSNGTAGVTASDPNAEGVLPFEDVYIWDIAIQGVF